MINIDNTQMQEIDYIIDQSMNGYHVLFDNETIKRFCSGVENDDDIFDEDRARETEKLLESFMSTPTISARKVFFKDLSDEEKGLLIRTYFNIIENNILSAKKLLN